MCQYCIWTEILTESLPHVAFRSANLKKLSDLILLDYMVCKVYETC